MLGQAWSRRCSAVRQALEQKWRGWPARTCRRPTTRSRRPQDRSRFWCSADGHAGDVAAALGAACRSGVGSAHVVADGGSASGWRIANCMSHSGTPVINPAAQTVRRSVWGLVGVITPASRTTRPSIRLAGPRVKALGGTSPGVGPSLSEDTVEQLQCVGSRRRRNGPRRGNASRRRRGGRRGRPPGRRAALSFPGHAGARHRRGRVGRHVLVDDGVLEQPGEGGQSSADRRRGVPAPLQVPQVQLDVRPLHGERCQVSIGAPLPEAPQVAALGAGGRLLVAGQEARHGQLGRVVYHCGEVGRHGGLFVENGPVIV